MAEARNALSFHGKGSTLFGKYLVNVLLSIITLGIYSFWGKVKILQYQYDQAQLNGSPFQFLGTGKQFFFGFLKFLGIFIVLELVLFGGMFGLGFAIPQTVENMFPLMIATFVLFLVFMILIGLLVVVAINSKLRYRLRNSTWRGLNGIYRGKNKELIPTVLLGLFLTVITLGIYGPWFSVKVRRYIYSKLSFGNLTLRFDGRGGELFLIGLKGVLLTIVTLGIYGFWYGRNLYRWSTTKSVLIQNGTDLPLATPVTSGALFKLWVPNILLLVITLGIAYPWIVVRTLRFFFANLTLPDALDLDNLTQGESGAGNALGESLGDFLDLGDFGIL